MKYHSRFARPSQIVHGMSQASMALASNQLRKVAFFRGEIGRTQLMREGLAALYHVVTSDYKYRPKDRLEYKAWLEEQDRLFLQNAGIKQQKIKQELEQLNVRLAQLDDARKVRMRPFYEARRRYFDYVFMNQYELDYLLDPVVTVAPDQVSFEAFSKDESSYARLGVPYTVFKSVDEFECGTTNIDYSARLHRELQRMRNYRRTRFEIDPGGVTVESAGYEAHKEKKIDLPESWVNGFLQVHSVMSMAMTQFTMTGVDLHNINRALARRKARVSPRALRYELTPGKRIRVVIEPFETVIELSSVYHGEKPESIRTWGRDRLQLANRLLPWTDSINVYLAGFGLPSFYCFQMGGLTFTLGLSGWTDNDWAGQNPFQTLNKQRNITAPQLLSVYEILKRRKRTTESGLAAEAQLDKAVVRSGLSLLCEMGRAIFDLSAEVFRHRELFPKPLTKLDVEKAVKGSSVAKNEQEKKAQTIFDSDRVRIIMRRPFKTGYKLSGSVKGLDNSVYRAQLTLAETDKIATARCTCKMFKKHKLTKGPCEHILALRLAHMSRLEAEAEE